MSKTKHTPGRDKYGAFVVWENGFRSAMPDIDTANKSAAAPEMLERLENLVAALVEKNSDFADWETVRDAEDAIRQARGMDQCCGGNDEHPPEHTQDCPAIAKARGES